MIGGLETGHVLSKVTLGKIHLYIGHWNGVANVQQPDSGLRLWHQRDGGPANERKTFTKRLEV
jgi:hypothetical protein